jgi:hypothetical protein
MLPQVWTEDEEAQADVKQARPIKSVFCMPPE